MHVKHEFKNSKTFYKKLHFSALKFYVTSSNLLLLINIIYTVIINIDHHYLKRKINQYI